MVGAKDGWRGRLRCATVFTARKHPVFAPHRHHPQRAFGGVIVDLGAAIFQVAGQCRPMI